MFNNKQMLVISDNPKDYQVGELDLIKKAFPLKENEFGLQEIGITTPESLLKYPTLRPMIADLILSGVVQPTCSMAIAYKSAFENESE